MFVRLISALLIAVSMLFIVPADLAAQTVTCSFYSQRFNGRRTASGQRFNNNKLTAASRTLAFGTRVRLTNPKNHHWVVVRVNDRGPFVKGRDISVTRRAARRLGFLRAGLARLEMEMVDESSKVPRG